MFYGYTASGDILFASEMKALHAICREVFPFPPGHYFDGQQFVSYRQISKVKEFHQHEQPEIFTNIREKLIKAVEKRLQSDVPVGFLLSGGLDSSLVCAIAAKLIDKPIKTFAVGINEDPIDTRYARIVADYLGTNHTEVLFTKDDIFSTLHHLIYMTKTFDITTIRASMGMYIGLQIHY